MHFGQQSIAHLNDAPQQKDMRTHLKTKFPADHVGNVFKAGIRGIYLQQYFGDVFCLCPKIFVQKILIGVQKDLNLVHAYLEEQRGKQHAVNIIKQGEMNIRISTLLLVKLIKSYLF